MIAAQQVRMALRNASTPEQAYSNHQSFLVDGCRSWPSAAAQRTRLPRRCWHRGFYIPKKPLQIKAEARHATTATGVLALTADRRPDQAAFAG
jgi:hypothetical protein